MGRSYRPGIGARGVIGIVASVVDECSVSKRLCINVGFRAPSAVQVCRW